MPPYPDPSAGPRRSGASARAGSVLTALIASAPASSQARATALTSPAAGVSLAISGRSVARRTAVTAAAAADGSRPNALPRAPLGHERLSSTPATPGTPSSRRAPSASSDVDSPPRFTITGIGQVAQVVAYRSSTRSRPGFWRPTPHSRPAGDLGDPGRVADPGVP